MKIKLFFLIACFLIAFNNAEKLRFDNYKLVRLHPTSDEQLQLIGSFESDSNFDIWNSVKGVNEKIDVALSPNAFMRYKKVFEALKINFEIVDENIQSKIDAQLNPIRNANIVGKYARYSEIINYIDTIVENNPDIASSYNAGKTYQKRDLKVLVLKTSTSKKLIWIDCGIHAREWVSPATCIYTIDKLINEYRNNDTTIVNLFNKYEFHILPVVNPDGYEYTWTTNRLWRKNRNVNPTASCIGVDLNRNFEYQWMVSGSSQRPCDDTYAGPKPASELETQAVQNAIKNRSGQWEMFFTLHSYGAFWMPPWGYTASPPSDYSELYALSKLATDAIKGVYGINYKIGPPSTTVGYSGSGGSYDYAKAIHNVKYAFALELRPQQNTAEDVYGFALPEDRVPLCGLETYTGFKTIFKAISDLN